MSDPVERVVWIEERLLARCRDGDEVAWAEFYRLHAGPVARFLRRLLGPIPDLDDRVQQTFVIAFETMPRYRHEGQVSTWLFGIAARVAARHRWREFIWRRNRESLSEWLATSPPGSPDQALTADARARLRAIGSAIEDLDLAHRTVWILREVEGLETEEVARSLGIPEGTVKSRLFHARRRIEAALAGLVERGK